MNVSKSATRRLLPIVAWCGLLLTGPICYSEVVEARCTSLSAGLVGWWRGEGTALDEVSRQSGILIGSTAYSAAEVGQGFVLHGLGDAVSVGSSTNLMLQDFTVEAWIRRADPTLACRDGVLAGGIFLGSWGSYGFALRDDGRLTMGKLGYDGVNSVGTIKDTNFHHVAVTKSGLLVNFYIDGRGESAAPLSSVFVFNGPFALGARGGDYVGSFWGTIDEVSVYNRPLSAADIQGIYQAGSVGKCAGAPFILSQPPDQAVFADSDVRFTVVATGANPLSFQWLFNDVPIAGATNSTLTLPDVQGASAGLYSVAVSSPGGSTTSNGAHLTVRPMPICVTVPTQGLVSWWRGEGNEIDQSGVNSGSPVGDVRFDRAKLGLGFVLDGRGDAINITNSSTLQLQNFTIQAWIRRANTSIASQDAYLAGCILCGSWNQYGFVLNDDGRLTLTQVGVGGVSSVQTVRDTNFHHVAVTKVGSTVMFYLDGHGETAPSYDPGFSFFGSFALGARGGDYAASLWGTIDEVSIYNRALSDAEIEQIYQATSPGICGGPPVLITQPISQSVYVGATVSFSVSADGTQPLGFQWFMNGTALPGATNLILTLSNLQQSDSGSYSVSVSNAAGSVTSSSASLTVNPVPACAPVPSLRLIGWWRGDGDSLDQMGINNGSLVGGVTFGPGEVGQGFVFHSAGDGVLVGNSASLQVQDFTIEAWIKRGNMSQASYGAGWDGAIFLGGWGSYGLGLHNDGRLVLTKTGESGVFSTRAVTDSNFHHVAVSKLGSAVFFYVDGEAEPGPAYNPVFQFNQPWAIGAMGGTYLGTFWGTIDEVAVFAGALSPAEIQAIHAAGISGKCPQVFAPAIISQPLTQTAVLGSAVSFSVQASGTPPLHYQWTVDGTAIDAATNASLTLDNVQFANAGLYAVTVSNSASSVTSSNALLTVTFPPSAVQIVNSTGMGGATVDVPVTLTANGNEYAVGFSVNFAPAVLGFMQVTLGKDASGAALIVNTNRIDSGSVGIVLSLPTGTFNAGTQELVKIQFSTPIATNPATTPVSFADVPTARQVSDAAAHALPATYSNGRVALTATEPEGDVSPAPSGDNVVTVTDWVQVGRYVARLDTPANGVQFQHADAAPRITFGDGELTVSDWVQVGRYAAGLDPLTPAGGPTSPLIPLRTRARTASVQERSIEITSSQVMASQTAPLAVELAAVGNENAVGFSVSFDPTALAYRSASVGADASKALLDINSSGAAAGRVAFVLALPPGQSFAAGRQQLLSVKFQALGSAAGLSPVSLIDQPVPREVSDLNANAVPARYVNGTIAVVLPNALQIALSQQRITLSWPDYPDPLLLQESVNLAGGWTNNPILPLLSNGRNTVSLPVQRIGRFYRLRSQ